MKHDKSRCIMFDCWSWSSSVLQILNCCKFTSDVVNGEPCACSLEPTATCCFNNAGLMASLIAFAELHGRHPAPQSIGQHASANWQQRPLLESSHQLSTNISRYVLKGKRGQTQAKELVPIERRLVDLLLKCSWDFIQAFFELVV